MDEMIPDSCVNCRKYVYKGDDEQYCLAARMRTMRLKRWQKKPKWCPMERRWARQEKTAENLGERSEK